MSDYVLIEDNTGVTDPALIDDYLRELAGSGSVFMAAAVPSDLKLGTPNNCFANCLMSAMASKGKYLYCEGLGIIGSEAYAHAWLTDAATRTQAYELTWRAEYNTGKRVVVPAIYKGVILDTKACWNMARRIKRFGAISNRHFRPARFKQVLEKSGITI